jgi:hypothetical protein
MDLPHLEKELPSKIWLLKEEGKKKDAAGWIKKWGDTEIWKTKH